ncbi:Protein LBH [Liparis tanakae]|uniref:Protein LBH n=1 Tax=Liparis tanakae TaxID=230148 RepID=A0A4Z2FSI1_9TELE|nr:Protein LBH [Liparis tanakae]
MLGPAEVMSRGSSQRLVLTPRSAAASGLRKTGCAAHRRTDTTKSEKSRATPVFVPGREMTGVMINGPPMEDMRLSPSKDRLSFQLNRPSRNTQLLAYYTAEFVSRIFPDPSDFERCCFIAKYQERSLDAGVAEVGPVEAESRQIVRGGTPGAAWSLPERGTMN